MTKTRRHHWLFKLWVKARGFLALLIIAAGVLVGIMSLLLPFDGLYKERLIDFLEQQWQMQVTVADIDGSWQGYGPSFILQDLSLQGEQSLQLKSAKIQLNLYQLLMPGGERGIDLSINEAELAMIQSGAQVSLKSNEDDKKLTATLDRLLQAGSLRVQALKLNLLDTKDKPIVTDLTADFLLQQDSQLRGLQLLIQEADQQELEIRAVTDRSQQIMKTARWYVHFNDLSVSFLQPFLAVPNLPEARVSGELWVTTEAGVITDATGHWQWQQSQPELNFQLEMSYQGDDKTGENIWHISDISINSSVYPGFSFIGRWQDDDVEYHGQDIPVSWLSHLLVNSLLPDATLNQRNELIKQNQGQIDKLRFRYNHGNRRLHNLSAQFSGLTTDTSQITVSGLSGRYWYQDNMSRLQIDSEHGSLILPGVFRGATKWQRLLLQADWRHGEVSQLNVNQLWCDCNDFQLNANAVIDFDEVPYLQLTSHIEDVDIAQLYNYWPHEVWKPKTIAWLDQGLVSGTVAEARLYVAGEIRPETFKNGTAVMNAQTRVRDASVQFNPDWPLVETLNATVEITADSIDVMIEQAKTEAIYVENSRVIIPDFSDVEVLADINANSRGNALIEYLSKSPVAGDLNLQKDLTITGRQDVTLDLQIPIVDGPQPLVEPQGKIRLTNGHLKWQDLELSDLNGVVQLDGFTLKPQQLKAQLAGRDTVVSGAINTRNQSGAQVDIQLQGVFSILDWFAVDMSPAPMSGESKWQIQIQNKDDEVQLTATTDLLGVALNLPAPLRKLATEAKKVSVICDIPCDQGKVVINYGGTIVVELMLNQKQVLLNGIQFGGIDKTTAKNIGGQIKRLNLDQWLELAKTWQLKNNKTSQQPLLKTDIVVDELIFMSRTIRNVRLAITEQDDGVLIVVNSDAVKGQVLVADDLVSRGITAEFDYLNWQQADIESRLDEATDGEIPDIHLWAEEFSFGGVPLGQLRLELRNVADGIKVEQLTMKSDLIELNANGEWLRTSQGMGTSRFDIVIISERIADFLQQMDFNAPISNAQTLIEMEVHWPGLPAAFDVAALSGFLRIDIGQGEVVDQQPGFGRVLGLFNLTNLPRRLLLDFRDVLSEGLHFEEMVGEFKLSDGVAETDNFLIRASAAKIYMHGVVNFVDRSYDQLIIIRPQIGKTFPTLGAIAGGPVGAAAGFLVQGLLSKQLKSANEIKYHVTGPWSTPDIKLLEQNDE
ncbi:YhdP family protein [Marinicella gelatinilytica]|uniref:YhdP family protein n=1 Tax=Marinicella gelatinilytica TaxID=2996017 RepID=UPI002260D1E5|nr:YhdP family protein [Marinicella gelatinilytica]MCX7544004.1 YhdP family protein [Marinicella gelatinilytica]